jgi:hypothetical protein
MMMTEFSHAEQARISDVPDSCTCTWTYGPPDYRWRRIGVKEDCPWHKAGDALMARLAKP